MESLEVDWKKVKIGILCTGHCGVAINILKYFKENGINISLIIIETAERHKLSRTQQDCNLAHSEFEQILAKQNNTIIKPRFALFAVKLWYKIPPRLREIINPVTVFLGITEKSVRVQAKELGVTVTKVKYHSSIETKKILEEHDIRYALLATSSWLIREPLVSMKNTRIINAHCAHLPDHRSLDSLPWSVMANDKIGITSHFVDAGIDTGPILMFIEVKPEKGDNLITLRARVDSKKPEIFYKSIRGLCDGSIKPAPQSEAQGVHHRPMTVVELIEAENQLQKILSGQ